MDPGAKPALALPGVRAVRRDDRDPSYGDFPHADWSGQRHQQRRRELILTVPRSPQPHLPALGSIYSTALPQAPYFLEEETVGVAGEALTVLENTALGVGEGRRRDKTSGEKV